MYVLNVGDEVIIEHSNYYIDTQGDDYHVSADTTGTVTRVGTSRMLVRVPVRHGAQHRSVWIPTVALRAHPSDPDAPQPRKLGTPPEGAIAPRDPRLKWLWEDAAALATAKGYCNVYDEICSELGLPGRPRNYTALRAVGQTLIRGTFLCQSQEEADELLLEELRHHGVIIPT